MLAKTQCPGHLEWSAFDAPYPDTVCSSAIEWTHDSPGPGVLCDADDDFSYFAGIPCPFCDPEAHAEYAFGDAEPYTLTWADTGEPVPNDTPVHARDGRGIRFFADRDGLESRVLVASAP